MAFCLKAQNNNDSLTHLQAKDSLSEVTVTAFGLKKQWQFMPAAIALINKKQLQLLNQSSLVPILNTVPGVRMEERSPGSYRLSIRGSLLRSPYGVRNIKVYWNDIPFSDAGGNTYLQLVDISQLKSLEIIKGPASSIYGATTGGAIILHDEGNTLPEQKQSLKGNISGGSYGLFNENLTYQVQYKDFHYNLQEMYRQSDGYRQQSALKNGALNWNGDWHINKNETLHFITFYDNLYYETPGGLTLQQLHTDTSAYPLAVIQKAAVYNKTVFAGISLQSTFNTHFANTTSVEYNHTYFKNPFTSNYELRNENNAGFRTSLDYHTHFSDRVTLKWLTGFELLYQHSYINDFGNKAGVKDTVQFLDELKARQACLFTQLNLNIDPKWVFQLGISRNVQTNDYKALYQSPTSGFLRAKSNELWSPRISFLYNILQSFHFYASAAKGFSPPSIAEIHPSGGGFNDSLQPEYGWNFELGLKGNAFGNRLLFDASVYNFGLENAIVRRSSATINEYYVNAGKTHQPGAELWLKSFLINSPGQFIKVLNLSNSFSYQPYKFVNYQIGNNNYDGNSLTGVPKYINVTTLELETKPGLYLNSIFNIVSSLPLDDANDMFAKAYQLWQAKMGYHHLQHFFQYDIYIGVDNILNQTYSLGNDINAYGRRFYNPAPGINYYTGIDFYF